jgi:TonB-linked SusC/RagA family outer membrane protein
MIMMNKLLCAFLWLAIIGQLQNSAWAVVQEKTISGKITSLDDGSGLPGVNVVEKGTTNGTVSDVDGKYTISVSPNSTLVFSSVGFTTEEITVGNRSIIDLVMNQDIQQLQEMVVVGFGTQKKENLTGAVGTVNTDVLESRPVNTVGQALQGLVPGLNITQSNGGNLNNEPAFNIRGVTTIGAGSSGQPLVLIDGMEADINTINPQDIESISVLKDAAASSIYGSRAPFGVILITTKNGKAGKSTISYTNNFRWNSPILMPKMMDSYTFALYVNDGSVNSGQGIRYPDEALQRILDFQAGRLDGALIPNPNNPQFWGVDFQPHGNTDWYDVTYRDSAPSMDHTLSFSGGNDATTYFISGNFLEQDGLMRLSYDTYQRYNLTTKISTKLSEWANITYTGRWGRQNVDQPSWINKAFDFHRNQGNRGWPTMPLYDNNGYLYQQFGQFDYAVGMATGGRSKEQNDWMYHQLQVMLEPAKGWTIYGNLNYRTENDFNTWNQNVLYNRDVNGDPVVILPKSGVEEFNSGSNFFNPNIYTEYQKTINSHNFKIMGGFQYEEFNIRRNRVWRDGIISSDFPVLDLTSGADINGNPLVPAVSGSRDHWSTAGFFGRLNYDLAGRYLLELNLRYDGTSRFREDQRWNLFPSVSAGWNIANETFWQGLSNVVNDFKIRASYGILGNQNTTSLYPTYVTVPIGIANGNWLVNGIRPNTAQAPGLISSTLGWESIVSYNIGFDLGLFENRLTGSFDYFERFTNDMVGPAPELPDILGTAVPRTNNTDLKTYGFELMLAWRDRLNNGLGYNVNLLLSDSKTEILNFPNPTGNLNQFRDGQMVGEIWGYTTKGIARSQEEMTAHLASLPEGGQNAVGNNWMAGDIMYTDINGDGRISPGSNTEEDPGDQSIIGNTTPRYSFGLDIGADWKGFDFRAFFQGVLERDFYQNSNYFFGTFNSVWNTVGLVNHADYFRDDPNHPLGLNLDSYFHRPVYGGKNRRTQTRYLQDASYMRLKNLQLGYTLPRALTQKVSVEKLRLYISGENLLTITNLIDIFDPETIDGGFGGNVYPLSRIYSVGMMLNF